jgi:hypothetical protein
MTMPIYWLAWVKRKEKKLANPYKHCEYFKEPVELVKDRAIFNDGIAHKHLYLMLPLFLELPAH